jgi:X-domain of DnaJ-containing
MKEMTSVASTMMTEEEKAELEQATKRPSAPSVAATAHVDKPPQPAQSAANGSPANATHRLSPSTSTTPADDSTTNLAKLDKDPKRRNKLTPEQKKKLEEMDAERKKAMEERVATLTAQLIERLRPFVDAKRPGENDDHETIAFQAKIKSEADDMKLESFGVEVCSIL